MKRSTATVSPGNLPPLIKGLQDPALYDHPVKRFDLIQTHISWVLLTGTIAYKIKKPINLGFLDFSTLEKRLFYCKEELRLNQRLAPHLYLEIVTITGTASAPILDGAGTAIEYAVKMKEFPQEAQLDRVLKRGRLGQGHLESLAREVAEFHLRIESAHADSHFGTPDLILRPALDNFSSILTQLSDPRDIAALKRLRAWTERTHAHLLSDFKARKRNGFIRECHGDMHLANMALLDDQIVIFDCLEFSENLRWIDIMSEVAFITMDMEDKGRPDFANRFLNGYLEITGDFSGLRLLRFFQVYRALVRAKVVWIQLGQAQLSKQEQKQIRELHYSYERLAEGYTKNQPRWLAITHGLSGSGKTTVSQGILDSRGAIRVRTDIERKRLAGCSSKARSSSGIETGLYTPEASLKTYERLAELATIILEAGFPVIADGAFLKRSQRKILKAVADTIGVPFIILNIQAPEAILRERLMKRGQSGRDASEANQAVLEHQMAAQEALDSSEETHAIKVQTEAEIPIAQIIKELNRKIQSD